LAREGSDIAGASLSIQETQVTTKCPTCSKVSPIVSLQDVRCQVCGTPAMDLATGRELEVFALEIEE
jgi:Zn finger protein HypA/HybF involved in hydrogenase expression